MTDKQTTVLVTEAPGAALGLVCNDDAVLATNFLMDWIYAGGKRKTIVEYRFDTGKAEKKWAEVAADGHHLTLGKTADWLRQIPGHDTLVFRVGEVYGRNHVITFVVGGPSKPECK